MRNCFETKHVKGTVEDNSLVSLWKIIFLLHFSPTWRGEVFTRLRSRENLNLLLQSSVLDPFKAFSSEKAVSRFEGRINRDGDGSCWKFQGFLKSKVLSKFCVSRKVLKDDACCSDFAKISE